MKALGSDTSRKCRMTRAQEAELEKILEMYEPYSKEEFDAIELDGEYDFNRMEATKAKIFLEIKEIID